MLVLGGGLGWRKRVKACAVMALVFVLLEIPYVLWMHGETGLWLVNQWQITTALEAEECFQKHLEAGEEP